MELVFKANIMIYVIKQVAINTQTQPIDKYKHF